jgi:hypothetical protein
MGLNFIEINPIPLLTSPLKGEELDKLALMRLRGDDELICASLMDYLGLSVSADLLG